jgi:hypothetical protein
VFIEAEIKSARSFHGGANNVRMRRTNQVNDTSLTRCVSTRRFCIFAGVNHVWIDMQGLER